MKQKCAGCGEELLGDVNRCWKCGKALVPAIVAELLPPVAMSVEPGSGAEPATAAEVLLEQTVVPASTKTANKLRPVAGPPPVGTILAALAAALAALAGAGSIYVALYSHWGLALASIGIVLAAWGTFSWLRGLALLAIVFCAIGVGIACFNLAVDVYSARHDGAHPFLPNTPVE